MELTVDSSVIKLVLVDVRAYRISAADGSLRTRYTSELGDAIARALEPI